MTYTHLTTNELTIIAHSFVQKLKAYRVAQMINRSAETVYRVYRYLETGASIADYQDHYMRNKQRCGRKRTQLSLAELTYINDKIAQGGRLTPLLGALSAQLVVTGELFTGCLNGGSSVWMSVLCPCEVSGTRMAILSAAGRLANWGEVFTSVPRTFRTMPLNLDTLKLIPSKAKSTKGGNDPDRTPIEGRNCTQCARKDG